MQVRIITSQLIYFLRLESSRLAQVTASFSVLNLLENCLFCISFVAAVF